MNEFLNPSDDKLSEMKNLILTFTLLAFASLSFAQEDMVFDPTTSSVTPNFMGRVMLVKGEGFAKGDDGEERKLQKGFKVYKDDTIWTGKSSVMKIQLTDTSIITLGVESVVKMEEWEFKTQRDRNATLNVVKGKVRAYFRLKSKRPDQLKVKTGNISMGIRGTKILANSFKSKGGVDVNQMALIEGSAKLIDSVTGFEKSFGVGDHYISVAKGDETKYDIQRLPDAELKRLLAPGSDYKTQFQPFLNEFDSAGLFGDGREPSSLGSPEYEDDSKTSNKSWRDTLNKLNEKLDEYETTRKKIRRKYPQ